MVRTPQDGTVAAVKAPCAAQSLPRPSLQHSLGMLAAELDATLKLLRQVSDGAWRTSGVRDVVTGMILTSEAVARNRRLLGRFRRARLLPGAMTRSRRQRHAVGLTAASPERLIAELGFWGGKAADAAPWYRGTPASRFLAGAPADRSVDYLFRVLLPREAWLDRVVIAELAGRAVAPTPHAAEVARQAMRDLADAWKGPAVAVELTGQAGGRWLIGGTGTTGKAGPVATIRASPATILRHITGRPANAIAVSGDQAVAAGFLAVRIPAADLTPKR